MDLSNFKAPYYDQENIWAKADEFYKKYSNNKIPVDIEDIIEFDLNLHIVPKQSLYSDCKSDAFLTPDCTRILVDFDHYFNPKNLCFVRFSLAHELGHLILHKEIIENIRHHKLDAWQDLILTMPEQEYKYIEWHAYEFAGRLLVPRNILIQELQLQKENISKIYESFPNVLDDDVIRQVGVPICRRFNVSDDVIAKRIRFEKIWDLWNK